MQQAGNSKNAAEQRPWGYVVILEWSCILMLPMAAAETDWPSEGLQIEIELNDEVQNLSANVHHLVYLRLVLWSYCYCRDRLKFVQ